MGGLFKSPKVPAPPPPPADITAPKSEPKEEAAKASVEAQQRRPGAVGRQEAVTKKLSAFGASGDESGVALGAGVSDEEKKKKPKYVSALE